MGKTRCALCRGERELWDLVRIGAPREFRVCLGCALDVEDTVYRAGGHASMCYGVDGAYMVVRKSSKMEPSIIAE